MKKTLLSTLVASLLFTTFATAETNSTLTSKEVSAKATATATKKAGDNKVKLVQEALTSLSLSAKALKALNANKTDEAKKDIELALGKLESILAVKDTPKLLPIENRMVVKNFVGSAKEVELAIEAVKKLIDNGKIQEAGELLYSLQSEIDLTVVSLPLVTYPDALKLASKYIIEKQPNRAKEVLKGALSTFAEVEQVIPIPLINTVELVAIASDIAKENREQALKHLSLANDELNKAEKLGYVSKSTTTYKQLHELIEGVEKEVKGPNKAEKLFEELSSKLKEFKNKILSSDKNESK
jgi:tetratricopeptide (TPR) repeat protein